MIGEATGSRHVIGLYALLLAASAGAWLWALAIFGDSPVLLGTALLAYGLGLRHAVDADHIAAIDNVVCNFMQQGKKTISVGLHFSLGHSTVVALACGSIALASVGLKGSFTALHQLGGLVGTGISAGFLFALALTNLVALTGIWRDLRHARAGKAIEGASLLPAGPVGRFLKRFVATVSQPWQMYPLGFLFGLGFDTASEVGVLGISAGQASHGMQFWTIMAFPALFAAGMTMIDTTDSLLMTQVYGWALKQPARKLVYNLIITASSVLVALVIGALEVLNLVAGRFSPAGTLWKWVGDLSQHFPAIGCAVAGALVASWIMSLVLMKRRQGLAARL